MPCTGPEDNPGNSRWTVHGRGCYKQGSRRTPAADSNSYFINLCLRASRLEKLQGTNRRDPAYKPWIYQRKPRHIQHPRRYSRGQNSDRSPSHNRPRDPTRQIRQYRVQYYAHLSRHRKLAQPAETWRPDLRAFHRRAKLRDLVEGQLGLSAAGWRVLTYQRSISCGLPNHTSPIFVPLTSCLFSLCLGQRA